MSPLTFLAIPLVIVTVGCLWLWARSRRQGLTSAELGHLRGFLREIGASPASRGRVRPVGTAEAPESGNPWDVLPPRA